jgi:hypothetical protein
MIEQDTYTYRYIDFRSTTHNFVIYLKFRVKDD